MFRFIYCYRNYYYHSKSSLVGYFFILHRNLHNYATTPLKKTDDYYVFENLNKTSMWKKFAVSRRGEFIQGESILPPKAYTQCNTLDNGRIKYALSQIKIKINSLNKELEDKIKARQKEIDTNKF